MGLRAARRRAASVGRRLPRGTPEAAAHVGGAVARGTRGERMAAARPVPMGRGIHGAVSNPAEQQQQQRSKPIIRAMGGAVLSGYAELLLVVD